MDWFVVLTPLLLIPILGLFAFVGCSLLFHAKADPPDPVQPPDPLITVVPPGPVKPPDPPDPPALASATIRVRFFPNSVGSTANEFRIVISGLGPVDLVQEGAPDSVSPPPAREATYDLTPGGGAPSFMVAAGEPIEFSCTVFEPNFGPIVIASVDPHCQKTFDAGQSYEIEFAAPKDSTFFGACTVMLI